MFYFFISCSALRFPNLPGKGTGIPPFFPFVLSAVIDMSDPWRYPEHRKVWILYTVSFLSVDNLILIILNGICVHKIDVLDSVYSPYDRPTLIFEKHIIFKAHFSSNFIRVKSSKLPSKNVKQFPNKFKHRPPPPYALLLNDFAVYSTTFAPSVRYKV